MLKKDLQLNELFEKILKTHFLTDYSSIDSLYPPHFCWDKFDKNKFGEIKNRFIPGNYLLYAHFPFCRSKCKFCGVFSLSASNKNLYQEYTNLIIKELGLYNNLINISSLGHIYLGGGTPTLFPLDNFFEKLYSLVNVHPLAQINIESTPESLNSRKLKMLKKNRVSRLLIGAQSLDPSVLKLINRSQRKLHFRKICYLAKEVGIPVINVELVAGLPGQTLKSFLRDLDEVIKIKPEGIHIYGYRNSPTTIFYQKNYRPSDKEKESQEEMMKKGNEMLSGAKYFYQGDDYCLNNNSQFRNHSLASPPYFSKLNMFGLISLGMSAIGHLYLRGKKSIRMINTMQHQEYKKRILKKEFPIEKTFLLDSDEQKRHSLIRAYRYGGLEIDKDDGILKKYKAAIDYLKRQNKVKMERRGKKIKLIFSPQNAMIDSKIFYSPKVIKRCKKVMNKY